MAVEHMPFEVVFEEECKCICTDFSNDLHVTVASDIASYVGDYEVTPKVNEQTLETDNKRMTANLKIKSIPFCEVSNPSGGTTVYIGSEVI